MKRLLLALFICSLSLAAKATHLAGGEITIQSLGSNQYEVSLYLYRDCSGIGLGATQTVEVTNSCITDFSLTLPLINTGGTEISQLCPDSIAFSTCNSGSYPGMEQYLYQTTVTLNTSCSDYTFQYDLANRNASLNVVNSSSRRFFVEATLNTVLYPNNNGPYFTATPIPYTCINQPVNYNYGVVEPDGDSVAYSLVDARSITNLGVVYNMPYVSGHSGAAPIPGITINSQTGELNFTPTVTGNYIVAMKATEYNGVGQEISSTIRDIQFVVINCANSVPDPSTGGYGATNFTSSTGAVQLDSITIEAEVGEQFCFDVSFGDTNSGDIIYLEDNVTTVLPGATVTYSGTNPVTATVCYTAQLGMNTNNTIVFTASDSACPVSGVNSMAIQIVIPQQPELDGVLVTTPMSCDAACDATATVTASGGVGPYQYVWAPFSPPFVGQGTNAITGVCDGTYVLVVTDLGDPDPATNSWDTTFTIADVAPITVIPALIQNDDCTNSCGGAISLSAFGGTSPFTYNWSDGGSGNIRTGLCEGVYGLTITDASGCSTIEQYSILKPGEVSLTVDTTYDESCFDAEDGRATLTVTPECGWTISGCTTPNYINPGSNDGFNTPTTYPAIYGAASNSTRTQVLFRADELLAAGMTAGKIDQIQLNVIGNTGSLFYYGFNIKMGCTTDSVLSVSDGWQTGLIPVFNEADVFVPSGFNGYDFDYTYVWDGESNLVVEFCYTNSDDPNDVTSNAVMNYTNTGYNSVLYETQNSISACGSTTPQSESSLRPMVRFANCPMTLTYNWPSGITNHGDSASGISAGTYIATVTTGDGCSDTTTFTIDQPDEILIAFTEVMPISCPGASDGVLAAAASGGTGSTYTYLWSTGASTDTISGLNAGTYTVTVTDSTGCTKEDSYTMVDPLTITVDTIYVSSDILCFGDCNGAVTVGASGGGLPLTYTWSNGDTGTVADSLCSGTYSVTISSGACFIDTSIVIGEPAELTTTSTVNNNVLCHNQCNGDATTVPAGGTAPYNYTWSNGDGSNNPTNLCVGTHYVTITDANNCSLIDSVVITEPDTLLANATLINNVSCNGGTDGNAVVTATGGTAPYSYNWSNNTSNDTLANVAAGTYVVTVTDANNCIAIDSIVITEPIPIVITDSILESISCPGTCDAKAQVFVAGGTAPYTYNWPSGNTTDTDSLLCDGTVTVTITDFNGCTETHDIVIMDPIGVAFDSLQVSVDISCNGACDGELFASGTGGTAPYTIVWNTTDTTNTLTNVCAGTYGVRVIDANGCFSDTTLTISEPSVINSTVTLINNASCNGGCDGAAWISATGGTAPYTYVWNTTDTTDSINTLCAGMNYVEVIDFNGCIHLDSINITSPANLVVDVVLDNWISCFGDSTGALTANVTGGTTPYGYLWNNGQTGASLTNLPAGTYTVTVTDAGGCIAIDNYILTEPAEIIALDSVITMVSCNNACDASHEVYATGGSGTLSYSWPGGLTGGAQTGLCAGNYDVTITDDSNCTFVQSVSIINPAALLIDDIITTQALACNGDCDGAVTASISGGTAPFIFNWSTGSTNDTINNLCAGSYSVTVTDAGGCSYDTNFTFVEPATINPTITLINNATCNGGCDGAAWISATGGTAPYTYVWNTTDTTDSINTLCAGMNYVQVIDANGCTALDSINITSPANLQVTISQDAFISCFGDSTGQLTANVTGGTTPYSFNWSNGGSSATIGNLPAGSYTVTVTDFGGCSSIASMTITEPNAIIAQDSVISLVTCNNACDASHEVFATGGSGTLVYSWPGGLTGGAQTGLCAGTYDVTITDDSNCVLVHTVNIVNPAALMINDVIVSNALDCNGDCDGELVATAQGGNSPYTFTWGNGTVNDTLNGLCAGTYSVTVTDGSGCAHDTTVTLVEPTVLTSNPITAVDASCPSACDGTATASGNGGTPNYNYTWSNGDNVAQATNLCPGTYYVTITDANGCQVIDSVVVGSGPGIDVALSVNSAACFNSCTGSATATPTNVNGTAQYSWSNGATTQTINGLCPGATYVVTVTDNSICVAIDSIVIPSTPNIILDSIIVDSSNCGVSDGQITTYAQGGIAPLTYVYNTTDTINPWTNVPSGNHNIQIIDGNGCIVDTNAIVNDLFGPALTYADDTVSCVNSNDGELTVNVVGSTANITYSWSNGVTDTNYINGLSVGQYFVTVTDTVANCNTIVSMDVVNPDGIIIQQSFVTSDTCNNGVGSIAILASGGQGFLTYAWSNGSSNPAIPNLVAGTYQVTVSDQVGCSEVFSFNVPNFSLFTAQANVTDATCNSICDGGAVVVPSTASTYTYAWSTSANTTDTETNMCAGPFTVSVTDPALNCTVIVTDTVETNFDLDLDSIVVVDPTCTNNDGLAIAYATGDNTPLDFMWNGTVNNDSLINMGPGTHQIVVTDPQGCTVDSTITVVPPFTPNWTMVNDTVDCTVNTTGTVEVSSPNPSDYTYLWDNGITTAMNSGLGQGVYWVTITDTATGCVLVDSAEILGTPEVVFDSVNIDLANCGMSNGAVEVFASGGSGTLNYVWNTQDTANPYQDISAGFYQLSIIDSLGCSFDTLLAVHDTGLVSSTLATTDVLCNGDCNGTAVVSSTGELGSLDYNWNVSPINADSIGGLCTGLVLVTVTDDSTQCVGLAQAVIQEPTEITVDQAWVTNSSCGQNNGEIIVSVSGGTAPYTYAWDGVPGTDTLSFIAAGNYQLEVTDDNGCTLIYNIPVSDDSGPSLITSSQDASCSGACDGQVSVNVSSGPNLLVLWSTGDTTSTVNNLCPGQYYVVVTDFTTGCISADTITVGGAPQMFVAATATKNVKCGTSCNGTIDLTVSGSSGYSFAWSDGSTDEDRQGLCAGNYMVTITDLNGCTIMDTIDILDSNVVTLVVDSIFDPTCLYSTDGSIYVTGQGGDGSYFFNWTGPNGFNSQAQDLINLGTGAYAVNIQDGNQCYFDTTIVLNAQEEIVFGTEDTAWCTEGEELILYANITTNTAYTAVWTDSSSVLATNQDSLIIYPEEDSIAYFIEVQTANCFYLDTIEVVSGQVPMVDAGPDEEIMSGDQVVLGGNPTTDLGGSTFLWTPSEPLGADNVANPLAYVDSTTTFTVRVTNIFGCSATDEVTITVTDFLEFPTGFSPNSDGVNDVWRLEFLTEYPNCTVEVFNRWGQQLFKSEGYNEPWDGTYEGSVLPVGTYYYVITLGVDGAEALTGPVTILR